jgi:hypothetical protein
MEELANKYSANLNENNEPLHWRKYNKNIF